MTKIYKYKNYAIEFNFYNQNEYSVQYCSDDCLFKTLEQAKEFIDSITKEAD